LQLDSATVSEVLRLHLLSSGAKRLPSVMKSDFQQRGGYVSLDDPGFEFCRQEKAILETLKRKSVSELSIG
jgi:bromodomain adjacent to zinc finger domain protein 1A